MKQHISQIALDSFAGRTRSHAFQPGVTAIIGANGAGKTTVANAINFVLSGKVPGLPKTNAGIMDALGSSLRMGAAIRVSGENDVATYDRALIRSGKAIKGEARNPAPASLLPPTMLDLQPFLDASPKVRAGMILGACGDDVPGKLRALLGETGMTKALGQPVAVNDDVQEWLASVDDLTKAVASGYAANIKDMRGTLAGMEVLDTSTLAVPAGRPLSELRAEVSNYEREIARLEGEIKALSSRPAPIQPTGDRPNGTAADFERQLADAQAALRDIETTLAQAKATVSICNNWQVEYDRLTAFLYQAQEAYQQEAREWEPIDDEDRAQADINNLLAANVDLQVKINNAKGDTLAGKTSCPCCGAKPENWERQAPDAKEIAQWEHWLEQNTAVIAGFRTRLAKQAAVSKASEVVLRANQDVLRHETTKPTSIATDLAALQEQADEAAETAAALAAEARKARAWDAYTTAYEQYKQDMAKVLELDHMATNIALAHNYAAEALAVAERQAAAHAQAEARQATRKQAEERLAELEKDAEAFKAARTAWDAGVKAIMDEALRGVLDVCQTFTAGLFAATLTVHNLALGRYEGNAWVPFDAFSGSDKRIATAAIQAALAVRHNGFKLILLDEFGVIDPARKPAVLANLAAAVEAGLVDQVLVMDNRAIDGMPDGVNVMHLDSNS